MPPESSKEVPARAPIVVLALILVAAVANLGLAVANVALPDIGHASTRRRPSSNLVAVGYSLGLACSVLWLGALGDRYGRKRCAVGWRSRSRPAFWPRGPVDRSAASRPHRRRARGGHGLPTTLALITALWARCRAHQVDRAVVGDRWRHRRARPARRGDPARALLVGLGVPRDAPACRVALLIVLLLPAHVNETTEPVDNLGGVLSVVLVGALVLAINFAAGARQGPTWRARP